MPMNLRKKSTTIITLIIVFSLFLQLIPLMNNLKIGALAQPEEIDNGDFTITAIWDFSDPGDYIFNNTTFQNDAVNLSLIKYYWNQTSQSDFDSGSYSNTTSIPAGDVVLGNEMKAVNLINNGDFTSDQNWTFVSAENSLSFFNSSNGSAQMGFDYKIGPKIIYLNPPTDSDDGFIENWFKLGILQDKNTSASSDIGYHLENTIEKKKRSYFYFDIDDIPVTASVNDVLFYGWLQSASINSTHLFDVHAMDVPRIGATPPELYVDCANGSLYIDDSDSMKSGTQIGDYEWNLGGQAITDLQDNLTRGWFGIGFHEEGDDDPISQLSTINAASNHPQLNVSYDAVAPVTFNEVTYINQTFNKPNVTPNDPAAATLSFYYDVHRFLNCSALLIVQIDGTTVWATPISSIESNLISLDIGDYVTASRDYELSLQLHLNVASQTHTEFYVRFDDVNMTTVGYAWSGNYISQEFDPGAYVLWDEIKWNDQTDGDTDLTIRTRNSLTGSSWEPWTQEYSQSSGDPIPSPSGRKIQFSTNLSTSDYSKTPFLNDVSISYEKYYDAGSIEMNYDYEPDNLRNWGLLTWIQQNNSQTLTYWYSTDSGNSWNKTDDGNLSGVSTGSGRIRLRTEFQTTYGNATPTLFEWNLTYEISQLSTILGSVSPEIGFIDNWYNFTVRYSDPENDPPALIRLNITEGTSNLGSWDMYDVNVSDSDYVDGKWYYYNVSGFLRGSNYSFHFAAKDTSDVWTEGDIINGPYILNSPPKIISENKLGAQADVLYFNDYEAQDLEDEAILSWSYLTNASWLSLDSVTGNLSGTPPNGTEGSYWVYIEVYDQNGGYDERNFTIVVGDIEAPVANAGPDQTVYEDEVVHFDGSSSTDNFGIFNYTWDYGISQGYGPTPSHVFTRSGSYIVSLTVRDVFDNHDVDVVRIIVINRPPYADAGEDIILNEGEETYFNASNSSDTPSDLVSLLYLWEFDGDDDFNDMVGINVSYTWFEPLNTTVKLRVIDDDGAFTEDLIDVKVLNVPPIVDIEDEYSGERGSEITIIASGQDPGNVPLRYRWDWENDGIWDTGFSPEFIVENSWSEEGKYTMVVEVWDGTETGTDTAMVEIIRFNIPPQLSDLGSRQIGYGVVFPIDLSQFITDEDTPLSKMIVTTDNPGFVSVDGVRLNLSFPVEMVGQTVDVLVTISDGLASDSAILTVQITINNPPILKVPFPDVEFEEDGEAENVFNLNQHFDDTDINDELEFELIVADINIFVTVDNNGYVTFKTTQNWHGNTTVVFRAWDPNRAFTDASVKVNVKSINDPPLILRQISVTSVDEDGNWTIDLDDHFLDVDTFDLTFTSNYPEIKIDPLTHEALWVPGDKLELENVRFTASDGEHSVSLDPVDLRVVAQEPFNWFLLTPLILLFAILFIAYRELHYRYTIEEVFLVDNAGVLLVHLSQWESKAIDAKLVSGMLTAVQEFVKDSFRGVDNESQIRMDEGTLGKLEYGDFQIVIERGSYTFLSAVISGNDNNRLRKRMKDTIDEFETKYSEVLANWDGDMAHFDGAERIVGQLLKNHAGMKMVTESKVEETTEETIEEEIVEDIPDLPSGDFGDVPSYYDEVYNDKENMEDKKE
jgi:hypothetical protein